MSVELLAPVTPLATCSAVALTDQNRVLSAFRATEIVSDLIDRRARRGARSRSMRTDEFIAAEAAWRSRRINIHAIGLNLINPGVAAQLVSPEFARSDGKLADSSGSSARLIELWPFAWIPPRPHS